MDDLSRGPRDKKKCKKAKTPSVSSKRSSLDEDNAEQLQRRHKDTIATIALTPTAPSDEKRSRRLEKHLRRNAKRVLRLREMGLDENGEPLDNYCLSKYPVREWTFKLPGSQDRVALNPVVFCLSVVCLWSLALWSSVDPMGSLETLRALRSKVSLNFGWFFQLSKALVFFFLVYITYTYGGIHLGRRNDKPEFSNFSYFAMIFAAGAGPAALVYGVMEPLSHQDSHFFAKAGYRSQDEIDMFGINLTISNWSTLAWTYNTLIGVCMSVATHRFQLPMTYRTCYYPIFGAYTWGWIGDAIDGLTAVVTIVGACIFLGITANQISTGLVYTGWIEDTATAAEITSIQNVIIWVVTIISTISVISGLRGAIQLIALVAVSAGCFLTFLIWAMEDKVFILNLQVQEIGYYLQSSLFQLNFWTDAFGQLREGGGRAVDGKAAEQWWMDAWLTYYAAWQVTIAAGIGLFVAGISRGRKLWEVVLYCWAAPTAYSLIWFCIWGGIGMRQQRQSKELVMLGETLFNNSEHFLADGSDLCYDVPQGDVVVDGVAVFTNHLPGITPVCQFSGADASLNVLYSFSFPDSLGGEGLGPWLSTLYLLGIALFFVASSDSASLMVDCLASNGRKNYHWARRMFWASTIGALTTSLVSWGGADSLAAVQSASYMFGFPVAILMCFVVQSTTLFCRAAARIDQDGEYEFPNQPALDMPIYGGIFNVMEYIVSFGKVNPARVELGMHWPRRAHVDEFVKGLLVPFVALHKILAMAYPQNPKTNLVVVACYSIAYYGWIGCFFASRSYPWLSGLTTTLFFLTGTILSVVRNGFRATYNLRSNAVADVLASLCFWPQVFAQLQTHSIVAPSILTKKSKKSRSAGKYDDYETQTQDEQAQSREEEIRVEPQGHEQEIHLEEQGYEQDICVESADCKLHL